MFRIMQEKSSAFYRTLVFIHGEPGSAVSGGAAGSGFQPWTAQGPTDTKTCPALGAAGLHTGSLVLVSLAQVLPLCGVALD